MAIKVAMPKPFASQHPDPTLAQIAAMCLEIQAGWSIEERHRRLSRHGEVEPSRLALRMPRVLRLAIR